MYLIVCLDNQNGMCFNGRRQSRDRAVIEKIFEISAGRPVYMSGYSATLVKESGINVCVSDNYLSDVGEEDFAFVERDDIVPYIVNVKKLFVFRWNRDYPADLVFPMETVAREFALQDCCEFAGNSHRMITLEVYIR